PTDKEQSKNERRQSSERRESARDAGAARSGPIADVEIPNAIASPDGGEEEAIGFPPYWNPIGIGNSFRGIPQALDTRDPGFHRYVVLCTADELKCKQGP